MSCATLARKTRATAPRFRRDKCFVLNMTGRGGFVGSKLSSQCKTKGGSHVSRCCEANFIAENNCKKCWDDTSRPAPQMGYGNYINRKAKGAYRPGGGLCCSAVNKTNKTNKTNKIVWKQPPNISASEIIQQKKDKQLACNKTRNTCLTGCKCPKKEKKSCPTKKNFGKHSTDLVRYPRINHTICETTKTLPYSQSGDQIAIKRTTYSCPKLNTSSFVKPMSLILCGKCEKYGKNGKNGKY